MESSRAIDRTGHFGADLPAESVVESNSAIDTGSPLDQSDYTVLDQPNYTVLTNKSKKPRKGIVVLTEEENFKKKKIEKAKINYLKAKQNLENAITTEDKDIAESELINATEAYKNLKKTFNEKVLNKVDIKIKERKNNSKDEKKAAITEEVEILTTDANKILLKNLPEKNVINTLKDLKLEKIQNHNIDQQKPKKTLNDEQKKERLEARKKNKLDKKKITENVRIGVEAAKELAVQDGLLIRTVKGKYIPNINKNDIGTLRKVYRDQKNFTISGHVKEDITTVGDPKKPKYVLRKNKARAANNNWSESLKLLKGNNVKMVGPDKFNEKFYNAKEEDKKKLLQNLQNYITVMTKYLNLIQTDEDKKYKDEEKTKKINEVNEKLNEATELLAKNKSERPAETENVAQDAQRLSAMDRDYRQSFQAAYQQKPFKADRYKLGSSDMHDWPSSAGSSVSSNRDSWYAEWNANRSY